MNHRLLALAGALLVVALASACASTVGPQVQDDAAVDPPPTPQEAPADSAPPLDVSPAGPPANVAPIGSPQTFRSAVGEEVALSATAFDPDGRIEEIIWRDLPPGAVVDWSGAGTWTPSDAGTWLGSYQVVDDEGASSVVDVAFVARYPANAEVMVAMGDSVASGHGLQEMDYLGRDGCWRDEGEAYPVRVFERLTTSGVLDPSSARLALVACSGHDTDDLFETPVTGGLEETAPDGVDKLTQLEWAIRANPRLVTITIGANDTGFSTPEKLLTNDGGLDRTEIGTRMAVIEADLRIVLERLTSASDADVYVTNYYNPTASRPQGVSGCEEECFAGYAAEVVDAMNSTIASVVGEFTARVHLVDIGTPFLGHGAPNGLGPDVLRSGGLGFLGSVVGGLVGDVHPYCAKGDTDGESWINSVDCVHPDGRGTKAIADIVVNAILN